MRDTPIFSAKIWNGSRILSVMSATGMIDLRSPLGCGLGRWRRCFRLHGLLRLADRPDHVQRALRIVLEFVAQDPLATVERLAQADELALQTGELLGREERL